MVDPRIETALKLQAVQWREHLALKQTSTEQRAIAEQALFEQERATRALQTEAVTKKMEQLRGVEIEARSKALLADNKEPSDRWKAEQARIDPKNDPRTDWIKEISLRVELSDAQQEMGTAGIDYGKALQAGGNVAELQKGYALAALRVKAADLRLEMRRTWILKSANGKGLTTIRSWLVCGRKGSKWRRNCRNFKRRRSLLRNTGSPARAIAGKMPAPQGCGYHWCDADSDCFFDHRPASRGKPVDVGGVGGRAGQAGRHCAAGGVHWRPLGEIAEWIRAVGVPVMSLEAQGNRDLGVVGRFATLLRGERPGGFRSVQFWCMRTWWLRRRKHCCPGRASGCSQCIHYKNGHNGIGTCRGF